MTNIRARFDIYQQLYLNSASEFVAFETAAFHLRKSIEAAAFACLVALENGLRVIPGSASGQWKAEKILRSLQKKDSAVLPRSVKLEIKFNKDRKENEAHFADREGFTLTVDELINMYLDTHVWTHEWNPYVAKHGKEYERRKVQILSHYPRFFNWLVESIICVDTETLAVFLLDDNGRKVTVVTASSDPKKWPNAQAH